MPAKPDARAQRTRADLDAAFIALLHRRAYDRIRVSDLTRKAGVGRATFYAHYRSKDELLRTQMQRLVCALFRPGRTPGAPDCRAFFAHVVATPKIFRSLMSSTGRAGARVVRDVLQEHFASELEMAAAEGSPPGPLPLALQTRFIASTLITVCAHALATTPPPSPDVLQQQFEVLLSGVVA